MKKLCLINLMLMTSTIPGLAYGEFSIQSMVGNYKVKSCLLQSPITSGQFLDCGFEQMVIDIKETPAGYQIWDSGWYKYAPAPIPVGPNLRELINQDDNSIYTSKINLTSNGFSWSREEKIPVSGVKTFFTIQKESDGTYYLYHKKHSYYNEAVPTVEKMRLERIAP